VNDQLSPVHLLGFPLALYQQGQEHHSELMREFSLIALGEEQESHPTVPARLLALVDTLTRQYGDYTDAVDLERDAALEAGLESVDLTYHVPAAAAEASRALGAMLDEADEFCRSGGTLLTLAPPPRVQQFRDWYLQEFTHQISGAQPVPWPDYLRAAEPDRS